MVESILLLLGKRGERERGRESEGKCWQMRNDFQFRGGTLGASRQILAEASCQQVDICGVVGAGFRRRNNHEGSNTGLGTGKTTYGK